jgi:hypothetical protein
VLSASEDEIEKTEEFERKYNFRFEEDGGDQVNWSAPSAHYAISHASKPRADCVVPARHQSDPAQTRRAQKG